jgi:hypothetical protein
MIMNETYGQTDTVRPKVEILTKAVRTPGFIDEIMSLHGRYYLYGKIRERGHFTSLIVKGSLIFSHHEKEKKAE